MRILYVITQGELGGAQVYVQTLAKAGKSFGNEIIVATNKNNDKYLRSMLEASSIKIWPLEHLVQPISPWQDILAIFELAKLYQNTKPNIIHLNSSKAGVIGTLAAILARINGIKFRLIYTAHGWVFNEPMSRFKQWFYIFLESFTAIFKDKIICVSQYDRQIGLERKIAPSGKLVAIHNGIATDEIKFLARADSCNTLGLTESNDGLILGTISNFYPAKGLVYLLPALKILLDQGVDCHLVIIGEGALRSEIEKQIQNLKLTGRVILAGRKNNAPQYLKAFDIAVIASVKEGLPYFPLEAMAAGLPMVATRVGGLPEIIIDNETGLLAEPANANSLAEKIRLLAENKNLRQDFGQAGLARVIKDFSQKEMIEQTFAVYKKY